jgi:hypothetical protein
MHGDEHRVHRSFANHDQSLANRFPMEDIEAPTPRGLHPWPLGGFQNGRDRGLGLLEKPSHGVAFLRFGMADDSR